MNTNRTGGFTPQALECVKRALEAHPELKALFGDGLIGEPRERKKRRGRRLMKFLRQTEEESLLILCDRAVNDAKTLFKKRLAMRDRLMVHIGIFCGLRIAEICALRRDHIDLEGATLFVHEGKGAKDRLLPIPTNVMPLLKEWLDTSICWMWFDRNMTDYLFPAKMNRNAPVPTETIRCRFRAISEKLSLRFKLHPHVLRHTAATRLLHTGADIETVRTFLGHDDLRSTAVYLHCDADRLRGAVEKRAVQRRT
jgi:integrase/recombinase XerC